MLSEGLRLYYKDRDYLKKNHIVISAGHSNAKYSDVVKAMKYGLSCTTHTYNAMSKLHHRDIGLVGAALKEKDLYAELILDYEHVSEEAAKLLFINKRKEVSYVRVKRHIVNNGFSHRYFRCHCSCLNPSIPGFCR